MTDNFKVTYTNKDIMDKLENIHSQVIRTNGTVKLHTRLIWGAYGFTMAVFMCILSML